MKGEIFKFSEQIKTHEHGAGIFLEYLDTEEGAERGVLYVPYKSISTGVSSQMIPKTIHPLGWAIVVPRSTAFRILNVKPLHEDKFHRRWAHEMHDKWKNEQIAKVAVETMNPAKVVATIIQHKLVAKHNMQPGEELGL